MRELEREIEHIKQAVKLGKATESLLEMLEDAERQRKALVAGPDAPRREDVQARLERVLADLPARVQACLQDLETLLRVQQVERGRDILSNLITEIRIHPTGRRRSAGTCRGYSPWSVERSSLWWCREAGARIVQQLAGDADDSSGLIALPRTIVPGGDSS